MHTPVVPSQASAVQALPSSHTTGTPAWQVPCASHFSPVVHGLPSSQPAPTTSTFVQPFTKSQLSFVHELPSLQLLPLPAHKPPAQRSAVVQALPSSQGPPVGVLWQPVASQLSSVQMLLSSQFLAVPWQTPVAQLSPVVQGSPSLQAAVVVLCTQPLVGSQASIVHGLLSSQLLGLAPAHAPSLHWPGMVQMSVAPHGPVAGVDVQPLLGSHASSVQSLPSSQFLSLPLQVPAAQVSAVVHLLPSSHGPAVGVWLHACAFASHASVVHTLLSSQLTLSVLPSQSLSRPSQTSGLADGALHALSPLAEHVRLPLQVPLLSIALQAVARPSVCARLSHPQVLSPRTHCATGKPSTLMTVAHV